MTPQPQKKEANIQLNLNTWLLTICVGLSGWALYSINQLDEKVAGMLPLINVNSAAVSGINTVNDKQSQKIEELANRLTKVETIQSGYKK